MKQAAQPMQLETLIWENKEIGAIRREERRQVAPNVWKSLTDGRYYTKGILGWWDITNSIERYLPPCKQINEAVSA